MRPVNLLPSEYRPRSASGALSGSSYVLVGALLAIVLMVGVYVLTANKVTSRENDTAEALQQTKAAQAKIASLGAYGDFATVAQQRSSSVKQLAAGRFDWERLTRELAHVLPSNVWLTEVDASVVPETTGAGAAEQQVTGPSAKLAGCAKEQPDVAKLMVRLRQMHRVEEIQLEESSRGDDATGTGGGASPDSAGLSSEGCGGAYSFEVTVVFDETAPVVAPGADGGSPRVPARLGGGE